MKKKKVLILLVLFLTIGFASVTTTLVMSGVIGIVSKKSDFKVIFTSARINGHNEAKATISEDKKKITFTTDKLSVVGESAELVYNVKNESTQYDANVTIICTGGDREYLTVESEFAGNPIPLENPVLMHAQEVKSGKIYAELIKSTTEGKNITVTCTLTVDGEERDSVEEHVDVDYTESLLNGADPIIKGNLVPIILEDDGTVKKADTAKEWYNYENKEWANAIILVDESINYNPGDIIPEDNIESYFVWIPKYKYKLWNYYDKSNKNLPSYSYNDPEVTALTNNSNARTIEIEFTTDDTTNIDGVSCRAPMISAGRGQCANGEWMTHPAFISLGVNGIWVGKFETGYQGATNASEAQVSSSDSSKIIVKPNVYSWRSNNTYNMFISSLNYNVLPKSHMMKNTEWGAVAYLSHSKYGINREVNINNNNLYKTGYSSLTTLDQSTFPGKYGNGEAFNLPYNTETGYLASTTGNITGVYDMSGGAHEYMAAYVAENVNESGFTLEEIQKTEYSKYLDVYHKSSIHQLYRILGDATGEMAILIYYKDKDGNGRYHNNWYADHSSFVSADRAWFTRGGVYDNAVLAGQFNFSRSTGGEIYTTGSRLVLAE